MQYEEYRVRTKACPPVILRYEAPEDPVKSCALKLGSKAAKIRTYGGYEYTIFP